MSLNIDNIALFRKNLNEVAQKIEDESELEFF